MNKEVTELINGIIIATKKLKPGGKILIISFHSIEDKIENFSLQTFQRIDLKLLDIFQKVKNYLYLMNIKIKLLNHQKEK